MKRREFITLLGGVAAALPLGTKAQQAVKPPRVGYLAPGSASGGLVARDQAFREGLRDLGYVDGKNIIIEARYAEGQFGRLPSLARELVELNVDVLVAVVTQASLAARDATKTIPIVIAGVADPVGAGLVATLSRPGANITGTSGMTTEVVGKTLEVLKEVVPKLSRAAVLWNPDNTLFQAQMLKETQRAADALGVQLQVFGVRGHDDLKHPFATISRDAVDALVVLADPILAFHQERIVEFADKARLPAIYGIKEFAVAGGLLAYASDLTAQFRRTALYVDKILKGAKPSELPVEQPTKFELVINLKTAKALGLTIPPTLLGRADEVIE
jgi:putative ABC transport system substrate-binding protein